MLPNGRKLLNLTRTEHIGERPLQGDEFLLTRHPGVDQSVTEIESHCLDIGVADSHVGPSLAFSHPYAEVRAGISYNVLASANPASAGLGGSGLGGGSQLVVLDVGAICDKNELSCGSLSILQAPVPSRMKNTQTIQPPLSGPSFEDDFTQ